MRVAAGGSGGGGVGRGGSASKTGGANGRGDQKNKNKKKSFLEKLDTVQMLILMLLPVGLVALIWVVYLQL